MKVVSTIKSLRTEVGALIKEGSRIALVPTMGNLHDGHLDLVTRAKEIDPNIRIIATIFVNPLQFTSKLGNNDFDKYPRTMETDQAKFKNAGCHFLFAPETVDEIYPKYPADTTVNVGPIGKILEGEFRPGFFEGVATVVVILINLCRPSFLLLGEKDYQQLQTVRQFVKDLHFDLEVIPVPTRREISGLAMSSRNNYLTTSEKVLASSISKVLMSIKADCESGNRDFEGMETSGINKLTALGFRVEYLTIRKLNLSLPTPEDRSSTGLVVLIAAMLNTTRLIDNVIVNI